MENALTTVRRDIDNLPLGCWQPFRTVAWVVVLVLVLAWASDAGASQRNAECAMLWDMALVARALAEDDLPQPQIVRLMKRIYKAPAEGIEIIVRLAVTTPLPTPTFAAAIRQRCMSLKTPVRNLEL